MKLRFDVPAKGHRHPLPPAGVRSVLALVFAEMPELRSSLKLVRLACNVRTTQEGRVVRRGNTFEIVLNFTVLDDTSRLRVQSNAWVKSVRACGGVLDERSRRVLWPTGSAAKYAALVLLHEVAHIAYPTRFGDKLAGFHRAQAEEDWCDAWAIGLLSRWNEREISGSEGLEEREGEVECS